MQSASKRLATAGLTFALTLPGVAAANADVEKQTADRPGSATSVWRIPVGMPAPIGADATLLAIAEVVGDCLAGSLPAPVTEP